MIRKDGFKLMDYPKLKKELLFDMDKDPEEMNDLDDKPEHQERIDTLFTELVSLQKDLNDPFDISHIHE